jgi:hypothetical protein
MGVDDPTGRLDILALKACDRIVDLNAHPLLGALYGRYRPRLEAALSEHLGPLPVEPVRQRRNGKNRR